MLTGAQYKDSLNDGRLTYFEGERIDDLPGHPLLGQTVDFTAKGYDKYYDPSGQATSALLSVPRSADDLRELIPKLHDAGMMAHVTSTSIQTLKTAAGRMEGQGEYIERMNAYIDEAQKADVRITQCITDAKGDRSRPPAKQDDADAYVHVVDRQRDGVVIRGAKLHITGASFGHDLLTIPTKSMKPGEEEWSIGCVVPVNAPGVRIINTTYAPRHEDTRAFPVSSKYHYPEGFVIFDDVFVPNERVFLDGETIYAAVFAHSLGLWERLGGLSAFVEESDQLVGFAQLVAEANGTAGISHVKEKISEMIIHATLIRSTLEAAIAHCNIGPEGAAFPNELYVNAGKFHAAANYNLMVRHLHDISGGAVLTAPVPADFENPEVGHLARKYMSTSRDIDGEYRSRLMHAIRDLTADAYGGWKFVTNLQAGGGLYAQRIVTRKHYDLDSAKRKALSAAGLAEGDVH
ncbi:MAG: 4-hydroxyphenylacetate 3-hydroxylase N-terminal domain-containing protein [Actinomycetota bacterium]|nr:4-hydroxyphenylacetate 3-hydroxylase N-terminal domain-containing protein [Actinomycetota bacterium]